MPNKNYVKGANEERRIVNKAREKGYIAFRSAGSHSPIDVAIISPKDGRIWLIQSKMGKLSRKEKDTLLEALKPLNGVFSVTSHLYDLESYKEF